MCYFVHIILNVLISGFSFQYESFTLFFFICNQNNCWHKYGKKYYAHQIMLQTVGSELDVTSGKLLNIHVSIV